MKADLLPPLHVMVRWREQGYSPEEIFEMGRKLASHTTITCGHTECPHCARGMCRKCYDVWYREQKSLDTTPQT